MRTSLLGDLGISLRGSISGVRFDLFTTFFGENLYIGPQLFYSAQHKEVRMLLREESKPFPGFLADWVSCRWRLSPSGL